MPGRKGLLVGTSLSIVALDQAPIQMLPTRRSLQSVIPIGTLHCHHEQVHSCRTVGYPSRSKESFRDIVTTDGGLVSFKSAKSTLVASK
ncbi:hypothetical protein MRB53_022251 [Persea americana]|uniref:Uncharacterized protein n=1 Tax=Persea americana TaxID=3435 RepID=A0ACC2L6L9_PERAE|nr:hypothetical protein MRB53_022251 [Persea americana]